MSFFKNIFGKTDSNGKEPNGKKPDINDFISSEDANNSIIDLDNYICALCDWGNNVGVLTEPQRNFYYNQNLEREVNNGGFNQYFFNSSGDFARETTESLKAIGAFKTAHLLQIAIDQFPGSDVPKDRGKRQEILEQIEEKANETWNDLDQFFYLYQDNLNSLNMEYVKANKDEF